MNFIDRCACGGHLLAHQTLFIQCDRCHSPGPPEYAARRRFYLTPEEITACREMAQVALMHPHPATAAHARTLRAMVVYAEQAKDALLDWPKQHEIVVYQTIPDSVLAVCIRCGRAVHEQSTSLSVADARARAALNQQPCERRQEGA